ncbi:hypothetical protein A1O1_03262 [Capronia coronata CBS 617.96]|uniref:Alpha-1,3-mannosyltransferase CMT1 n=1 Tax=Capronia coronata CBS 617.96 TaxID=1182541 RepID=W9ZK55_9EURO|nr:uncharacterized protein A1O1_03262 [Capronia coronata CBS 617.96]EXJ94864.1 hypothetical protein A1O1_03262 [Capronia coronata CBS 617.96]
MRRVGLLLGQALLLVVLCSVLVLERSIYQSRVTKSNNCLPAAVDNTPALKAPNPSSTNTRASFPSRLPTAEPPGDFIPFTSKWQPASGTNIHPLVPTPAVTTVTASPTAEIDCPNKRDSPDMVEDTSKYLRAIMNSSTETGLSRLECGPLKRIRYAGLHHVPASTNKPRYFFALDLYQSTQIITQLFGSIVEVIRFLGPELCAVSVVEGRSTDGTFEVLKSLAHELGSLGVRYHLSCNELDPKGQGMDRIVTLAQLRNQALWPLTKNPGQYDPSTTVIILNDIALCAEDILELIQQRVLLKADMTCGMDWNDNGNPFYDVWIGRQLNGDSFFEIPQSGSWEFAHNLFWNHEDSRRRYASGSPVQVFSCWNGAVTFIAEPFLEGKITFRSNNEGECYLGEPVHLAKDLWKAGHGRIAILPSVNVGYSVNASAKAKEMHGTVSAWAEKGDPPDSHITWQDDPPGQIKCMVFRDHQSWEPWDQSL